MMFLVSSLSSFAEDGMNSSDGPGSAADTRPPLCFLPVDESVSSTGSVTVISDTSERDLSAGFNILNICIPPTSMTCITIETAKTATSTR